MVRGGGRRWEEVGGGERSVCQRNKGIENTQSGTVEAQRKAEKRDGCCTLTAAGHHRSLQLGLAPLELRLVPVPHRARRVELRLRGRKEGKGAASAAKVVEIHKVKAVP